MVVSKIGKVELISPDSEDRMELPEEVLIDVQDHVQAHVQAGNKNPSRRHLLQWGFTMMAINVTLIFDFSTKPLAGLYIFAVYCGVFMGLLFLLLAATLPWVPFSAIVIKNMVRTTVVLLHIVLGLAILILFKK